ncbi:MAG: nitrilase-related carbon-nitrogen hydrolase, partial [Alphaproteobacteria bacterium]
IINVTNDGWFGDSLGPKQHLAFSQMRAIEENLYFFRSANTGISAIINTNGMLIKIIPYGKAGIIKL